MNLIRFKSLVGMVVASSLGLMGPVVQPARADQQSAGAEQTAPPPPPRTPRLIRIGPQALVSEDEQGNLTMVDEPGPSTTNLQGAGILFSVLTVSVLGAFYDDFRPGVAGAPNIRNGVGNQ